MCRPPEPTCAIIISAGESGSLAAAQGDAAPGAAIEHVVAARETAQALESLDNEQVRASLPGCGAQ